MAGEQKQNFVGRHLVNVKLTGAGSEKDTRHHEIAIEGGATYLPGDALGVLPRNDPALVERVERAVGATGDEPVAGPAGTTLPLRRALTEIYNLTTPSRKLLELLASRGASDLAPLLDRANAEQLKHYFNGWNEAHDVLDVLEEHASIRVDSHRARRLAAEVAPAPLLDRVEPGCAPRPSASARRVGAIHRPRTRARGRLLHLAGQSLARRRHRGHVPAESAEALRHAVGSGDADDHGRARHRARAVPRVRRGAPRHRRDGPQLAVLRRAATRQRLLLRRAVQRLRARRAPPPRRRVLARPGGEGLRPAPHARAGPRPLGVARGRRGVLRLRRQGAHGRRRRARAARDRGDAGRPHA